MYHTRTNLGNKSENNLYYLLKQKPAIYKLYACKHSLKYNKIS